MRYSLSVVDLVDRLVVLDLLLAGGHVLLLWLLLVHLLLVWLSVVHLLLWLHTLGVNTGLRVDDSGSLGGLSSHVDT